MPEFWIEKVASTTTVYTVEAETEEIARGGKGRYLGTAWQLKEEPKIVRVELVTKENNEQKTN